MTERFEYDDIEHEIAVLCYNWEGNDTQVVVNFS